MRKKVVSPAHRRAVAQELVKNETCSQRAAFALPTLGMDKEQTKT